MRADTYTDVRSGETDRGGVRGTPGAVLTGASVGVGLMAGLFFAFDVGVMPGLAKADDAVFVSTMQHINEAIENGLFGLVFIGAFIATGVAAALQHRLGRHRVARLVWGALGLYTVMLVVTMAVNIPLNMALARVEGALTIGELSAAREAFEVPWKIANAARTLACTGALCLLGRALTLHGRTRPRKKG